ncbi:Neurotransmitter-gated ion-channel ligand-binding domain-containing protein [Aphelenchoides bicaudatus]|nr:Neurotransmitter-gated ion-channel ligand-binding domain-containing protein [Aphelenchoides bicaudatus]
MFHLKTASIAIICLLTTRADDLDQEEPSPHTERGCEMRHNLTNSDLLTVKQLDVLENCLYYHLAQLQPTHFELINEPPWAWPLKIRVDHYAIQQVDMVQKTSSQFNIRGDLYISWNDTRLEWNATEWGMTEFALHDNHHIWTPSFNEDTSCSSYDACISKISDVEITSEGTITAKYSFRFPSFCSIDYYQYPQETNDCCLMLSASEIERNIKFELQTKERMTIDNKAVAITVVESSGGSKTVKNVEASVWSITDRTIDVVKVDGFRTEIIRLCVHARKSMPTLRIALRIPATIATLLMLTAPLFGDLRIQSFVKLGTLFLQTICFLFTVSVAPDGGFGNTKPKLYTFYEFTFFLTFCSIMITLITLSLCRINRTVPPTHVVFLTSKLINRFFCCIEPESNSYQRHLEDGFDSNRGANGTATVVDYTHEWRQVYIAVNNLFSGLSFFIFCFAIIFELM